MHRLALLVLALALSSASARAQGYSATSGRVDTVTTAPPDTGEFHMTKSPLEAVLLSAVLPGAGQVYLDQAWKLPILYGLAGAFFYGAYIQNSRYHSMLDSINKHNLVGDTIGGQRFFSAREFYRDDRDKWIIYMGITYLANILDAYIAANLYDFDVSNPGPSPIESYYDPFSNRIGIRYTLRF